MRGKYIEPSIRESRFNCPHSECGTLTAQKWHEIYSLEIYGKDRSAAKPGIITETVFAERVKDLTDKNMDKEVIESITKYLKDLMLGEPRYSRLSSSTNCYGSISNLFMSVCTECNQPSFWIYDRLIYPSYIREIDPHEDMPEEVKKYFVMAAEILDKAPPATAALARLCIELLCIQLLNKENLNLFDAIGELVKKGLDERVQKKLDFVRYSGNQAIHPGELDVKDTRETAQTTLVIVNEIVEELISRPAKLDALYSRIPDSKRQSIDERDKKQ